VNEETIESVRRAGADLIVAGSAVFWHDDPAAQYERLAALVAEPVGS
jgi:pentose-5-phosphate-3-epimerase